VVKRTVWLKVCSSTGEGFNHSMAEGALKEKIRPRAAVAASQMAHINKITERKEIREPRDETTFQVVKASG